MLHAVEKFGQIEISNVAITTADDASYLFGRSVSGTFRSKTKARFGKARIEDWR